MSADSNRRMERFARKLGLMIGGGVVLYVGFAAAFMLFIQGTTWVWTYRLIRSQMQSDETRFFPERVPSSASMVRFSTAPAFLQGGSHTQLRLRLPEKEIQELEWRYRSRKTQSYFGGGWGTHINQPGGMPATSFYTSGTDERDFPEDYEIMVFDRLRPESEGDNPYFWNHGTSHGVALSRKRSEIIYWTESW